MERPWQRRYPPRRGAPFSQSVSLLEDDVAHEWGVLRRLLPRKAAIEAVDQNVCINESGHARRGPLFSNLFGLGALTGAPMDACGGVRSPGRTNGAVTLDFQVSLVWPEELHE